MHHIMDFRFLVLGSWFLVLGSCFFPHGLPLEVSAAPDGTPLELRWRGRRHTVERVLRCWRIDERWWRERVWRDYWQVATRGGPVLLIFRELPEGQWRLQRVID